MGAPLLEELGEPLPGDVILARLHGLQLPQGVEEAVRKLKVGWGNTEGLSKIFKGQLPIWEGKLCLKDFSWVSRRQSHTGDVSGNIGVVSVPLAA